jgi:hypothetical protein
MWYSKPDLGPAIVLLLLLSGGSQAETLALVGGTVIDVSEEGRSSDDLEDAVVVIEDGRIRQVGRRGDVEIPAGASQLDVSGRYLVPGLTEGFGAHNNQTYAQAYLHLGVTSVITVSGGRRGPLFTDADPGPHLRILDSVGDGPAALEEHMDDLEQLATSGVDVALLMYGLTAEQLPAITARADELGLATIGELGFTSYEDGIRAGIDAFVHTTRYSLGLAPSEMAQAVAAEPFSNDLESPKWQYYRWLSGVSPFDEGLSRYARMLGEADVSLMPTFSLLYLDRPDAENPWNEPTARLLDPEDINAPADRDTGRHDYDAAHQVAYSALARSVDLIEESYRRAGARYLAGSATDVWGTMPGISLHRELEALVRIGLTPREALAAATSNFEATFPNWGQVGQIRPGYQADVLVLDADPREDVRHLEAIDRVILAGRVFSRDDFLEDEPRVEGDGSPRPNLVPHDN